MQQSREILSMNVMSPVVPSKAMIHHARGKSRVPRVPHMSVRMLLYPISSTHFLVTVVDGLQIIRHKQNVVIQVMIKTL